MQKKPGVTAIYVIHDHSEALALSDRIVVLDEGILVQVGYPHDICTCPDNRFVVGFVGLTSFLEGVIVQSKEAAGYTLVRLDENLNIRARQ
jgi:ABC-type Fe3+/spermidine/putrescine transport system ATPase subunit